MMTNHKLAQLIVARILDRGLRHSTWRDNHPNAYTNLLEYRDDMVANAASILRTHRDK